jgi:hypothetical protein
VCDREWEEFLRLEMEFRAYSYVGREVGVGIYRWGFTTSHWADFAMEDRLNSLGRLIVTLLVRLAYRRLDWSIGPVTG